MTETVWPKATAPLGASLSQTPAAQNTVNPNDTLVAIRVELRVANALTALLNGMSAGDLDALREQESKL